MGKIIANIIWIREEYDWNENLCNRAHSLDSRGFNHGYGESWMFLRTLRDHKDFSLGNIEWIYINKKQFPSRSGEVPRTTAATSTFIAIISPNDSSNSAKLTLWTGNQSMKLIDELQKVCCQPSRRHATNNAFLGHLHWKPSRLKLNIGWKPYPASGLTSTIDRNSSVSSTNSGNLPVTSLISTSSTPPQKPHPTCEPQDDKVHRPGQSYRPLCHVSGWTSRSCRPF